MNAFTKVSEKGQVVVPKAVRDRLGWSPGVDLAVIETADGIFLRRRDMRTKTLTVDEAVARLRTIYRHKGRPIPVEDLGWSPDVEDHDAA